MAAQTLPTGQKMTIVITGVGTSSKEYDHKAKALKRKNNLYQEIISVENLSLADQNARQGKATQYGVMRFDKQDRETKLLELHRMLKDKTYKTSAYTTRNILDPKPRKIFCLPYFPDRIVHHAVMIPLERIFVSTFTTDTYSCIKNKGVHAVLRATKEALQDGSGTTYCLKLDVKKFYPTVNHEILKQLLRKKLKDNDLLWLLDEIIDSAEGLPIGNYLSQYFANFYLTYFDHWIKEELRVKYYFRYADDMVILSDSKAYLHQVLFQIKNYLLLKLKLIVKSNYQVFPVKARSIDFVGYRFYHTHVGLRKSIKKSFARAVSKKNSKDPIAYRASIASYKGWTKHGNCRNLEKKLLHARF